MNETNSTTFCVIGKNVINGHKKYLTKFHDFFYQINRRN